MKKALVVKNERDYLTNQIGVARDSISILSTIVANQDSVILTQDSSISLYRKNESNYTSIIGKKDGILELKDEQIKQQKSKLKLAWGVTGLTAILFILTFL